MNRLQHCFDDDAGDESGEGWNQLFQGMRHDPSAPLMDFAARDHSPALKAWTADEPCGYVDGLNVYNAPPDDPINAVEPLGT